MDPARLSLADVERAYGAPPADWRGQCFAVSTAIVRAGLVSGRAVYGHYLGPVNPLGYFGDRRGLPFQAHGWVRLDDGRILDPTRWVFEGAEPYLFLADPHAGGTTCLCSHDRAEHPEEGECDACYCEAYEANELIGDEYDEGGDRFRAQLARPAPVAEPAARTIALELDANAADFVTAALGHGSPVGPMEAHWLATLPYAQLGACAGSIYGALIEAGCIGFIPLDNRRRAQAEQGLAA